MRALLLCVTLLGCVTASQAGGVYRCKLADGSTNFSDIPCNTGSQPPEVIATRPPAARDEFEARINERLSSRCQYLRSTFESSSTRRRQMDSHYWQAQQELRQEYRRDCEDDEQIARLQVLSEHRKAAGQAYEQRADDRRASQELNAQRARCVEQRQFIDQRQSRVASMGPGERGDYDRAVAQFEARCRGL